MLVRGQTCFKVLEFNPEDLGIEQRPKTVGSSSVSTWRRDSSAAKGVASRRGVGNTCHLHTPWSWLQRLLTNRVLRIWVLEGTENEADIGTKPLGEDMLDRILKSLSSRLEQAFEGCS